MAFTPDEPHLDPGVGVARVREDRLRVLVAGDEAADVADDVGVAVGVEVGEGHAVPLLQVAGARGRGHVDEGPAVPVAEEEVGDEGGVGGRARTYIEVGVAVVVEVAEVGAHGGDDAIEASGLRNVLEAAAGVVVEPHAFGAGGKAQVAPRHLVDRGHEAGHEQVEPSVVVVVEEPGGEAHEGPVHAALARHLLEGRVAPVAVEEVGLAVVRDVEVHEAVVVEVAPGRTLGEGHAIDPRPLRDVLEGAVAPVSEEGRRRLLVGHEQVEPSVVVVVGKGRGMRAVDGAGETCGLGHVGEGVVGVLVEQGVADRELPAPAHHEKVEATVVVVVGLGDVDAPELVLKPRFRGPVAEGPVRLLTVVAQGRAGVHAREHDVEASVAVEVVHHHPARTARSAQTEARSDVGKASRVFARGPGRRRDQPLLRHAFGVPSEGHVGHVQEPAHLEIVRVLAEVALEPADSTLRARGLVVGAPSEDREDAALGIVIVQAVLQLAESQVQDPEHGLEVAARGGKPGIPPPRVGDDAVGGLGLRDGRGHAVLVGEELAEVVVRPGLLRGRQTAHRRPDALDLVGKGGLREAARLGPGLAHAPQVAGVRGHLEGRQLIAARDLDHRLVVTRSDGPAIPGCGVARRTLLATARSRARPEGHAEASEGEEGDGRR